MQKMFFELIQVSLGELDCLDRGPSNEEWGELYELSRHHGLTSECYQGVVRLFDFGLRAPQDLSIDWMAEAETAEEQPLTLTSEVCNPIRKMLFERWQERNGNSLFEKVGNERRLTPSAAVVGTIVQAFEQFNHGTLTLRSVVDCYKALKEAENGLADFRDGSSVKQMLQTFGLWRFSRAMMWTVAVVTGLDAKKLACPPAASTGQFLLQQVMGGKYPLKTRIKNKIKKFLLF